MTAFSVKIRLYIGCSMWHCGRKSDDYLKTTLKPDEYTFHWCRYKELPLILEKVSENSFLNTLWRRIRILRLDKKHLESTISSTCSTASPLLSCEVGTACARYRYIRLAATNQNRHQHIFLRLSEKYTKHVSGKVDSVGLWWRCPYL